MAAQFDADAFAREWIAAWNSRDLDAILSRYAEDVVLTSPVAARLLNDPTGTVRGKAALRSYFQRGLEVYPNLRFELLDVMSGLSSVVLVYLNQKGTKTAEFMEFDKSGKVVRVVANYSGKLVIETAGAAVESQVGPTEARRPGATQVLGRRIAIGSGLGRRSRFATKRISPPREQWV